jgi:tetratricopeptide (TPR) repeat protein
MLLYQLAFVALLVYVLMTFGFPQQDAIFFALIIYFILFYTMRSLVTYNHRMGIRSYRRKQFEDAIEYFRESREFFAEHPKLDRYRFAVVFSVARLSYRELAESNSGFCYIQLRKFDEAENAFRRALEINPDNSLAGQALEALQRERAKYKKNKKKQ